jgi:alpha-mannosidase
MSWHDDGMRISGAESTVLFTGSAARARQIIRVTLEPPHTGPLTVRVAGPGVSTPEPFRSESPEPGPELVAEVGILAAAPHGPGSVVAVTVIAETPDERAELAATVTVAEPGWTMWMVSHFHYDPVWWDTQAQFTQARLPLPGEDGQLPEVRTAFDLVALHLAAARADPDYKFVLAEIDYLKPYFDTHPRDRAWLAELLATGRVELVGGCYNEPNTNLTSAESTIRNAVYGLAHQRDVLGGDPRTAWMLDAFGHDPGFPSLMAGAGLTSSAWARGPYHQWGPLMTVGSNERMQFPSEFEWVGPDGSGLLTSYMPNHYGAGWVIHQAADLAGALASALAQFLSLAPAAATRNVLLPVGADHVIPARWVTAIHREWNARYVWPRFVTALPREFFAAVRAEAASRDIWLTPQSRDMNPVYPGKDVSYIDTKQAQRAAETAVSDGEKLATLAWLAGAPYPAASLDRAWRLLVFGAHHDAITGTESDQVYLDLLGGWREAWQRGEDARRAAMAHLAGLADTRGPGRAVVVFSTLSWPRSGPATVGLALPPGTPWLALRDDTGAEVPCLAEGVRRHPDGTLAEVTLTFWASGVPALGYRTWWAAPAPDPGGRAATAAAWQPLPGTRIRNEAFAVAADPARGGLPCSVTWLADGTELLAGPAELVLQQEYAGHPKWGEGPWLLSPRGPGDSSAGMAAQVRAEHCPAGQRLVSELRLGGLAITHETLLWHGSDRVEMRTHVSGRIGQDRLLRARFPLRLPGALPVFQTATAVIGRPFGHPDADVAEHPFTLDNPAHEWFGLGAPVRVRAGGSDTAIGVAEIIVPAAPDQRERAAIRDLVAALAAQGVTATCSRPEGPRYGSLDLDSNLPDVRIAVGGPDRNPWTAALLEEAGLAGDGGLAGDAGLAAGPVWLPAARPRGEVFVPGADVRGMRDLPVLIVTGDDLAAAAGAVTAGLAGAVVRARPAGPSPEPPLAGHTAALLNRGIPGSLVTPDGTLCLSLMRSCSAWPCGVWIDGERRTAPDGSSFAWQHWSHTFEYALAAGAGDWRSAGFVRAGQDYNHPLLACATEPGPGPLPPAMSLCQADGPAMVTALKPRGNPLGAGRPAPPPAVTPPAAGTPAAGTPSEPGPPWPHRADGVTVRLRPDGSGHGQARLRLFTGLTDARLTSLCEDDDGLAHAPGGAAVRKPEGDAAVVNVPPAGVVTAVLLPAPAPEDAGGPATGTADAPAPGATGGPAPGEPGAAALEPGVPEFARYWLHNKGPAPAGNLPVTVSLHPSRIEAGGTVRLTVACGPAPAAGAVTLDIPPGLTVTLPDGRPVTGLRYDLPSSGYACWDLTVRAGSAPAGPTAAGRYYLTAGIASPPGPAVEDAVLVTVGEPPAPALDLPLPQLLPLLAAGQQAAQAETEICLLTPEVTVAPGCPGEIVARLANRTAGTIRGESLLISPFGTWDTAGPPALGFAVPAGGEVLLRYPLRVPAAARPGQWWALAKVAYFGRLHYTECATVTISG